MTMTRSTLYAVMKIFSRHKSLFCYVVLVWGIATLISRIQRDIFFCDHLNEFPTALLGNWTWSRDYVQQFPETRQILLKHHPLMSATHPKLGRTIKYCNLPRSMSRGQEGTPNKGDHLEAVVVVTRHGDRGALNEFRNSSQADCDLRTAQHSDLSSLIRVLHEAEQLQLARGAFAQFPLLPPLGRTCALGQLSAQGLLQMLRLGRYLRSAYGKKGSSPLPLEHTVAYSTSVMRTYQSLLAFLYGFMPSFNVSSLSIRAGLGLTFCYSPAMCDCPILERLEHQVRAERSNHLHSHPAVKELIRSLTPPVKGKESERNVSWPDDLFDVLMVHVCHGGALPCHPNDTTQCATVDQVNNLLAFLEWSGKQVASYGPFKRSSRLRIHGFLTDVAQKLNNVKRGNKKHRVFVYSGHDVTLMPLMSVLGFYDGNKIPYASRLVFELYSSIHPLNVRLYHLKILYNGRDVTKKVAFCQPPPSNRTSDKFSCPLNNFVHYVNRDFFNELRVTNFKKACVFTHPN